MNESAQSGAKKLPEDAIIHRRIVQQEELVEQIYASLPALVPELTPFDGKSYAHTRVVVDWDHQLPSAFVVVRLLCWWTERNKKRALAQLAALERELERDDLYPEFDLPDYGRLSADEIYVAAWEPGQQELNELRFAASWRRDVPGKVVRKALESANDYPAHRAIVERNRDPRLGSTMVMGWTPPCLAEREGWCVELWLLIDFDGQQGTALVMIYDRDEEAVVRHYTTSVQIA